MFFKPLLTNFTVLIQLVKRTRSNFLFEKLNKITSVVKALISTILLKYNSTTVHGSHNFLLCNNIGFIILFIYIF